MDYPLSRRGDVVETLHGQQIADPYRWLEDPDDPETVDWVERQNTVSEAYLASLPERPWFVRTMTAVLHRPRAGVPFCRGGRYVVARNDGHTDQDIWYVADSLAELRAGGRVLVDPNRLSSEGPASLQSLTISADGRYAALGVSESGSDWQSFRLRDLTTGEDVPDPPITTKFCSAEWLPDGRSFVYLDFGHSGDDGTGTGALSGGRLKLHRIGQPIEDDDQILAFPENDQIFLYGKVIGVDRYLAVTITEGTDSHNRLWLYPLGVAEGRTVLGEPIKIIDDAVAEMLPIELVDGRLYLETDLDAPRGRVVWTDPTPPLRADGRPELREVYRPGEDTLLAIEATGGGMAVATLSDVTPVVQVLEWDGTVRHRLPLTGGSLVGLNGRDDDHELCVGLSSVTSPASAYQVDTRTGEVEALDDLLRFHRFTVGAAWKSDYGDPDDADDFAVALAYSPLHTITEGASYPATLVLTGDHDDRVVPLHSHKFTAALQWAQSGDAPVLTRIETATGHGAGKPTTLVAAEWADLLAFCAHHTGLAPGRS
jgi:prolyl oligopeptidase